MKRLTTELHHRIAKARFCRHALCLFCVWVRLQFEVCVCQRDIKSDCQWSWLWRLNSCHQAAIVAADETLPQSSLMLARLTFWCPDSCLAHINALFFISPRTGVRCAKCVWLMLCLSVSACALSLARVEHKASVCSGRAMRTQRLPEKGEPGTRTRARARDGTS